MLLVDAHTLLQHAVRPHVKHTTVFVSLALTPHFRRHSNHHFGQLHHLALYDAAAVLPTHRLHLNLACMRLILLAHPHNIASTLYMCVCVNGCARERGKLDVGSGPWSLQLLAQTIRQVLHPMTPLDIQQQPTR